MFAAKHVLSSHTETFPNFVSTASACVGVRVRVRVRARVCALARACVYVGGPLRSLDLSMQSKCGGKRGPTSVLRPKSHLSTVRVLLAW